MSSASENEFSESSNLESPQPQDSPYSSPGQEVPYLASAFSGISCDDVKMHIDRNGPYLRIVEQPQDYFRFRYKSEMVGTHGCLLGKSTGANKARTHPTVELVNYTGKALIRVRLSQAEKDEEHPHKLLEDEQEDRDVSTVVPQQGSYKVGFAGMGIIHTAKKDVPGLLFKKHMERSKTNNVPVKNLRAYCENTAKSINLNIVKLRFSAHDLETDMEICPPVFSEPIHNMKSAATNDLKICRISRYYGRPRGGEDVYMFVEKVNKKYIKIRFYELNDHGEKVWEADANFLQSDVHHQYAIFFRTPAYRDPQISKDVKVYIELVRTTDGRSSEPKDFVFKADQVFRQNKRRRVNSSLSSIDSSPGGSIKSIGEVPTMVEVLDQADRGDVNSNIPMYHVIIPQLPAAEAPSSGLAEALALAHESGARARARAPPYESEAQALAPLGPEPPVLSLDSAELKRLIDPHLPLEDKKMFYDADWTEYMKSFNDSLTDKVQSMEFLRMSLCADSDNRKTVVKQEPGSPSRSASGEDRKQNIAGKAKSGNIEYSAYYKAEDGNEVKKLVREICEIIKKKGAYKKQIVRTKLERLLDMRLSNGDTFLHMALSNNQPSLQYIINLVHSMRMPHLLNLTNDQQQTILHLAVINDLPKLVPFLISKGCDPLASDVEGNTAVHFAVLFGRSTLQPLLDAVQQYRVACNLNAYNYERQTALHLAAMFDAAPSVRALVRAGASIDARDSAGRSPLHLAAYDNCLAAARALIELLPPSDIDAVDGGGNTALQIVCGKSSVSSEALAVVKMLLDRQADPLKHAKCSVSAWRLAQDKPALRQLLVEHSPAVADDDIKSEPDDDFESADEGESMDTGLSELPLYVDEVCSRLDAAGSWRALAARLHADALVSWYEHTRSPARTLLTHIKESGDNLTSKSLAMHLHDMGEVEAANVIRRYIE